MKNRTPSLHIAIMGMDDSDKLAVISFLQDRLDNEVVLVGEGYADVVLIDMDGKNARIEYLCQKQNFPKQPIILFSQSPENFSQAICIGKPVLNEKLITAVKRIQADRPVEDLTAEPIFDGQHNETDEFMLIEELLGNTKFADKLKKLLAAEQKVRPTAQTKSPDLNDSINFSTANANSNFSHLLAVQGEIDRVTKDLENEMEQIANLSSQVQKLVHPNGTTNSLFRRSLAINPLKLSIPNAWSWPVFSMTVLNAGILLTSIFIYTEISEPPSSPVAVAGNSDNQIRVGNYSEGQKSGNFKITIPTANTVVRGETNTELELEIGGNKVYSGPQALSEKQEFNQIGIDSTADERGSNPDPSPSEIQQTASTQSTYESLLTLNTTHDSTNSAIADTNEPASINGGDYFEAGLWNERGSVDETDLSDSFSEMVTAESIESDDQFPEIQTNVHAYSENPDERFVVLNMIKYYPGQRLYEGPLLEQITPSGSVLKFRGQQYVIKSP